MELLAKLILMVGSFKDFAKSRFTDEAGAVTVEWVVLTSAVVALAAGISGVLIGEGDSTVVNVLKDLLANALEQGVNAASD